MAGPTGLEPATSGVTGLRSNQLSYDPVLRPRAPREEAEYTETASRCKPSALRPIEIESVSGGNMKKILTSAAAALLLTVSALPARSADTKGVEKAIVQMEKDWTEAGIKKDVATLDRILADDWMAIDFEGKTMTKAAALADMKSGASTNSSVELGEMKVRVYGDTAIVHGSDTEKSTYKGKDSSGHYVWTDVFVKRNGRWQAVSSQSVKTK